MDHMEESSFENENVLHFKRLKQCPVRTQFETLVKSYHYELTSNGMDHDEASSKSIELAKLGFSDDPKFYLKDETNPIITEALLYKDPPSLHITTFQKYFRYAKEDNDETKLKEAISKVFSNPESLNSSFLKIGALDAVMDPESSGLDIGSVRRVFRSLKDLDSDSVLGTLSTALQKAAEQLGQNAKEYKRPESLRVFVILFENPWFMEPEQHNILANIFSAIKGLPETSKSTLVLWWSNSKAEHMQHMVSLVHQFITVQMYSRQYVSQSIADAVMVLELFYRANSTYSLIEYQEFYNDAVNNILDFRQDYIRWLKNRDKNRQDFSAFSFSKYPFILDPNSKSKILEFDTRQQQGQQFHNAMLSSLLRGDVSPFCTLYIHRENLIYTALTQLTEKQDELKKPLRVQFAGEQGLDEGGVRKEFFQLVVREIFDVNYGMFTYNEDTRTFWFNPNSFETEGEFKLIGIIIGLAIYNQVILDVHFPLVVYKKLLRQKTSLKDIKSIDPELERGLEQLLNYDGDVEETFCRTFEFESEAFGERVHHELKPGGSEVPVTNENREEFIDLYVDYFLNKSIQAQFDAFQEGFEMVIGGPILKMFRSEELEQLVCGCPDYDFNAWQKAAHYQDGYDADSDIIRWFWEIVHDFDVDQKKKLISFVTGSDRAPIKGLGSLPIVISRHGPDSDRLPSAHTCFNHLLIPEYSSKEKLRKLLLNAINNAQGFGLI
eukprot:gb/GECH01014008.1/.p1 GENE.gb/GECH01014008.1/~~gb/GECH01014008.1/.p1  ORF type:complete len:721 (+),score=180.72 gb/GECH01014008.1/:1-2163(+)